MALFRQIQDGDQILLLLLLLINIKQKMNQKGDTTQERILKVEKDFARILFVRK